MTYLKYSKRTIFYLNTNYINLRKLEKSQLNIWKGKKLSLEKYFSIPKEKNNCISNQFYEGSFQIATTVLIAEKENLKELSCDTSLNLIICLKALRSEFCAYSFI